MSTTYLPDRFSGKVCARFCPEGIIGCLAQDPPSVLTIRRAFTAMARHLWYNADNLGFVDEIASCMHYDDNDKLRNMSVDALYSATDASTENVPGVYVGVSAVSYSDPVMSQGLATLSSDKASRRTFQIATAQLTLRSLNIDADISIAMTEANYFITNAFRPRLHYVWPWLQKLSATTMTSPEYKDNASTQGRYYKTELVAQLVYEIPIVIREESLRLRDVGIQCSEVTSN